jgi:hypothetical protein
VPLSISYLERAVLTQHCDLCNVAQATPGAPVKTLIALPVSRFSNGIELPPILELTFDVDISVLALQVHSGKV